MGATNYKGDLDDNFTLKFTKPGLTFLGGYKFHPHMSVRLMLSQGWMKASDAKAARDVPRLRRNLSFRSPISEASVSLVWEFFANNRKFRYRTQYTPYIFGGVAVFRFNPQAMVHRGRDIGRAIRSCDGIRRVRVGRSDHLSCLNTCTGEEH